MLTTLVIPVKVLQSLRILSNHGNQTTVLVGFLEPMFQALVTLMLLNDELCLKFHDYACPCGNNAV